MSSKYDVTVVIVTYNSDFASLRRTVISVLLQQGIKLQIVVTDDGSSTEKKPFALAKELMVEYEFVDYIFIDNSENKGTCKNYYCGVQAAEGEYIKGISPGDFLSSKHALSHWINHMKKSQANVSFSDAIYYKTESSKIVPVKVKRNPRSVFLYRLKRFGKTDCVILGNYILGASFLINKKVLEEYLGIIKDSVIYAEDCMYWWMMIDEVRIDYYSSPALMYEYGSGISTSGSDVWKARLYKDHDSFYNLLNRKGDYFTKRLLFYKKQKDKSGFLRKLMMIFLFPTSLPLKIIHLITNIFGVDDTSIDIDEEFIHLVNPESVK